MKKLSLLASVISVSCLIPASAIAADFSIIYGFGDSLSETGNIYQATENAFPVSPPYFEGRFSNGPIWLEILGQKLETPVVNFSFGGATSGLDNIGALFPGFQQQIANFVFNNPVADPNALYTIWIGANDYLPTSNTTFEPFESSTIPLMNIKNALNSLVGVGAKNIMVFNLPNLGEIPDTSDSLDGSCPLDNQFDADCLNALTNEHNNGLLSLLSSLTEEINIITVDVNNLLSNTIKNPQPIFTNVTDSCLNGSSLCDNPDEYLFWDGRHPARQGHKLIADLAFQSLAIPEPKTTVGLLIIGLVGIIKKVVNKQSKSK